MPFKFNPETFNIEMACGDTANIVVTVEWESLSDGDVMLFAIFDKATGEDLLVKTVEIAGGAASIRLCNHDTRDIDAGRYAWNLRIVTGHILDEQGNVRVDECGDNVITVFDKPPVFKLTKGGAYV